MFSWLNLNGEYPETVLTLLLTHIPLTKGL